MNILGISALYHDSAAALVSDGKIIAAAQEERFTRRKQDHMFPINAVQYVLKAGRLKLSDLDYVVFYERPDIKLNRILMSFIKTAPKSFLTFMKVVPAWIVDKLNVDAMIRRELGYQGKILKTTHHQSHAASAFYPSPFERAAFLTIDGVGEWETTTWGTGLGNQLNFHKRLCFPHSLGMLYSSFTYFTGFKVNSGEYKVMGLAPYGEPKHVQKILDEMIDIKDDGSFHLNGRYFDFDSGGPMITPEFEALFGRPARRAESQLTQDDMDMARSVQEVTEIAMLKMANHIRKETGEKYLCLAGGVALNCVANGKILRDGIFDNVWVQPAAGDAGGALGAAMYTWHQIQGNSRQAPGSAKDLQRGSYLGPAYSNADIRQYLDECGISYTYIDNIEAKTAELLSEGNIIGWFSGSMEFGPRSLGGRSIIGDPRNPEMQKRMNLKIKYRESFRPFAPSVLEERMTEWFEIEKPSPYMLMVADVKKAHQKPMNTSEMSLFGIDKLNVVRSDVPAITHVDYSARIQSVTEERSPRFYRLIKEFEDITGCPMIINTSMNVRGEPIVCSPGDAYLCFMRTDIDYLVMENCLLKKNQQKGWVDSDDWREEFVLD